MTAATSIYIHIPFCVQKCPYCAFDSAPPRAGDKELFLRSLAREFFIRRRLFDKSIKIRSLYIGGGTPTMLDAEGWRSLIELIENNVSLDDDAEVTVEANPGTLTREHLSIWRTWRVNRISIGAQSFDDAELEFLGRAHDARTALDAIAASLSSGAEVSVDLIFGMPGSTLRTWAASLDRAASLGVGHISIYQLTIEPGTPFASLGLEPQEGYAQYRYAQWMLRRRGFVQYEIANFARPGRESRHNLNYWANGGYVGLGPGAWSFIDGERYRAACPLDAYAQAVEAGDPIDLRERLDREPAAREAAVLALRTSRGIDWASFTATHGTELARTIASELANFPPDLVTSSAARTHLTQKGMRVANAIWSEIV